MDTHSSPAMVGLERLTATARQAAEEGRWDLVDTCYREREHAIIGLSLAPRDVEQLRESDRQVQERARLAQAALTSLIRDAAAFRRRLKGLRQGQGAPSSESGMLLLKA